ncbi:hypothetical protein CEE45_02370 [Candidatus Heimdallarchaeota archaeon B3_Heim]|nr:MAG: hypothetical protein CEE45_02370 [Candidatus Heimdallarchaeota archaeon B3_Heim]
MKDDKPLDLMSDDKIDLRKGRLHALVRLVTVPKSQRGKPQALLKEALEAPIGSEARETALRTFFEYVPQGWIESSDAEDQQFLLHALQQSGSFWWDFG